MTTKTIINSILLISIFSVQLKAQNWSLTPQNGLYNNNLGNVGIGTTTPSAHLEIIGSTNSSLLGETGSVICTTTPLLKITGSYNQSFESCPVGNLVEVNAASSNGHASKMILDANGNLALGDNLTPAAKLDVDGQIIMRSGAKPGYIPVSDHNGKMHWTSPNTVIAGGIWYRNQDTVFTQSNKLAIGIGTSSPKKGYMLSVNGNVVCTELRVLEYRGWDAVFEDDYDLMSLNEVKDFISTHKHLPNVEPARDLEQSGIDLSEMNGLLLRKIEELTLYTIQLQGQIDDLKASMKN